MLMFKRGVSCRICMFKGGACILGGRGRLWECRI